MYACMCIHVCMYAFSAYVCIMHVCMCVCMYVCRDVCMYACMHASNVCMYLQEITWQSSPGPS